MPHLTHLRICSAKKIDSASVGTRRLHSLGTQAAQLPEYQEDNSPGVRDPQTSTLMSSFKLFRGLNKNEWCYNLVGGLASVIMGYCYPAMAIITGHTTGGMVLPPSEQGKMRHEVSFMGWWHFFVSCISFIPAFVSVATLSLASDMLVKNIRLALFHQLI